MKAQNSVWIYASVMGLLTVCTTGCLRLEYHPGAEVIMDVRSRQTGQPVAEWVVESRLWSNMGWTKPHSPQKKEVRLLRVVSKNQSDRIYKIDSYTDGGIILVPPLGYGGISSVSQWIYALGYDVGYIPNHETRESSRVKYTYLLEPWKTHRDSQAVRIFLAQLKDKSNFDPYEAIRGTQKGEGVAYLYRYYVAWFEAILKANPDMNLDPAVKETVEWLREAPVRPAAKWILRNPIIPQHTVPPAIRFEERVIYLVVKDKETGKVIDQWVYEIGLVTRELQQKRVAEHYRALSVAYGTIDEPRARVPAYTHSEKTAQGMAWSWDRKTVYVTGYEPEHLCIDRGCEDKNDVLEYHLRKWDNDDAGSVANFEKLLQDKKRFKEYEEIRRKEPTGCLSLYEYLLTRYNSLGLDQQEKLSPDAKARIDWICGQLKD